MKFHDSDPTINWLAHSKGPVRGAELVDQQLSNAYRYYNTRVEIERVRREQFAILRLRLFPTLEAAEEEYQKLDAELEAIRDEIKGGNAKQKKRSTGTAEQKARIKTAKEQKKFASDRAKTIRAAAKESLELKTEAAKIDEAINVRRKEARANCGVHWGSYLGVERAVQQASNSSKAPPAFKRWTGDGTVSVQLQGGMSWDELMSGEDTRIRFVEKRYDGYDDMRHAPSGKRKKLDGELWLRVGSEGIKPVWAVFHCRFWRIPPVDCLIKWVHVDRIKRANKYVWQVRLVLSRPLGWDKGCAEGGAVGIDVGWRLVPDGLRVAYWVGNDGREGQLVLPQDLINTKDDNEAIQTIRDCNLNALKLRLSPWLAETVLPGWFTESAGVGRDGKPFASILSGLPHWKSPARFEMLYHRWVKNRFENDEVGFAMLRDWRNGTGTTHNHGDLHLWRFQTGRRIRGLKRRKDIFRNFARDLARRYAVCRVEKLDLAAMRRRPTAEEKATNGAVIHFRNLAANAELFECLKQSGMAVEALPAQNTTRMHLTCGHISDWTDEERAMVRVTCQGCGEMYDQDRQSADLLLHGGVASADVVALV